MFEDNMVHRREQVETGIKKTTDRWARLVNFTRGSNHLLAQYGTPTGTRFNYPINRPLNRENVDAMRKAEQNLDAYWSKLDGLIHRNAGKLTGTATRQLMLQSRILQHTPEWVEPLKTKDSKQSGGDPADIESLCKLLSEIYFDLEHRTERTTQSGATRQTKTKQKTRRVPAPATPVPEAQAMLEADSEDKRPTFVVDNRALKVFKILFYTPSTGATPGDVSWTDFLYAMVETGFRAEKLYGSVWQFSPSKLDIERSIQFHEPHPRGKIPYWIARRHGRRLNRAYGWFSGMFELAQKGLS